MAELAEQLAPMGHSGATLAVVLAWSNVLTPLLTVVATVASIIWFLICIWESATCKSWRVGLHHWMANAIMRHRARVLVRLRARELKVQARIAAEMKLHTARVEARTLVAEAAADAATLVAHQPVEAAQKAV